MCYQDSRRKRRNIVVVFDQVDIFVSSQVDDSKEDLSVLFILINNIPHVFPQFLFINRFQLNNKFLSCVALYYIPHSVLLSLN